MSFWEGFNQANAAVSQFREKRLLGDLANNPGDTSARNKLMALDPQLMGQMQTQQRQQQQYDQENARNAVVQQRQDVQWQQGQEDHQRELATQDAQAQRDEVKRKVDQAMPFFYQASQIPDDNARLQWMQQNAATYGVSPADITPEHSTANAVQAHLMEGMSILDRLKLDEQGRHNQAMENRPMVLSNGAVAASPTGGVVASNSKTYAPQRSGGRGGGKVKLPGKVVPLGPELDANDGW